MIPPLPAVRRDGISALSPSPMKEQDTRLTSVSRVSERKTILSTDPVDPNVLSNRAVKFSHEKIRKVFRNMAKKSLGFLGRRKKSKSALPFLFGDYFCLATIFNDHFCLATIFVPRLFCLATIFTLALLKNMHISLFF